jgi:ribonuclease D
VAKILKSKSLVAKKGGAPVILLNRSDAFAVIREFAAQAQKNKAYALDTETGGLYWYKDPLYMISLYTPNLPAIVIPLAWDTGMVSLGDLKSIFSTLVAQKDLVCYLFNAKFDMHFMANADVMFPESDC